MMPGIDTCCTGATFFRRQLQKEAFYRGARDLYALMVETRKMKIRPMNLSMMMAVLILSGCATKPVPIESVEMQINTNLVSPSPLMHEMASALGQNVMGGRWEASRMDELAPSMASIPDIAAYGVVVHRDYQRLRISNGRPREYSNYRTNSFSRTIRR